MKYTHILLSLIIFAFAATLVSGQSSRNVVLSDYGKLPLSFEVNSGQSDASVKFLSCGRGYSLFLTDNEAVIALRKAASQSPKQKSLSAGALDQPQTHSASEVTVLRMQLAGANTSRAAVAQELPGKVNYFIGNDTSKWRTNVTTFAEVKYEGVYPGVDLVYYGNQGQLEYDFVVAPGADPNRIELKFRGAGKLRVDENGNLLLGASGEVRLENPVVYQTINGERKAVEGHYVLSAANLVGFRLGAYDHTQAVVIDPILSYSTYLGGVASESGRAIAVDASGNAYITGETGSSNFPTTPNAFQPTISSGGFPAFVSKLNASGSALVYSTFLGGNQTEVGYGIAADASGNAYVTGSTRSTNFPTAGPFQSTLNGAQNAFVTELNPTGSALVYSTYLGGNGFDQPNAIDVDASGNAYVTGSTRSTNFPTLNAIQPALGGSNATNAFVTKVSPSGSTLVYSTYLGGGSSDQGNGIALDSSGSAYVVGQTNSTNFPTVNALQPAYKGSFNNTNAFVTKFNPSGSALAYSTYLGGSSGDQGNGIAVDASGNAYVTGVTGSSDFPTANALQPTRGTTFNGRLVQNAFVSKLNSNGSALVYSTYLGGSNYGPAQAGDGANAIAVDASGKVYITGIVATTNFPTVNPFQSTLKGIRNNVFVSVFNTAGSALVFSTYLGGSDGNGDAGMGIAVDASGNAYVTGVTGASDFPTANAFQPTAGGNSDAFITKISSILGNTPTSTTLVSSLNPAHLGQSVTFTATVTPQVSGTPGGAVAFWDGSTGLGMATLNSSAQATFTTASLAPGTHSITAIYGGDGTFSGSSSAPVSQEVSVLQSITVAPNPASVGPGKTLQFMATGHYSDGSSADLTTSVTWSSSNTAIATISNAAGTQGLATGVDAAKAVATIAASVGSTSGTAQLTITHHK